MQLKLIDMETECKAQENAVSSSNVSTSNEGEVLGSVTQQTDSEGGIQLRTSARVSKKLKLDSLAQATSSEKREVNHEEEKKVEVASSSETKPRAKRVDWSMEDKVAFFEALNEFGKDIDAIHNYLVQKAKRRGGQDTKTKDQVRFFYYRMWSILSKHINFPTYIKKQTQELYALINFGELRKKISLSNKKLYEKLNEMIYSGATQLKFRGKVRKVRTPLCKALRKLNQIEESSEELRLPSVVTVELRPRSTEDWCRVQGLAQNPRVRSTMPLHRRLESLLEYLHNRWRPPDDKLKEQILGGEAALAEEEGEGTKQWALHVGPKPGTHVAQPSVRLSEVATSSKLSLLAYEQRFHPNFQEVPALLQQLPVIHRSKGRGVKRPRTDSLSEAKSAKESEDVAGVGDAARAAAGGEPTNPLGSEVIESAMGQLLSLHCLTDNAQTEVLLSTGVAGTGAAAGVLNGELSSRSPVKDSEPMTAAAPTQPLDWTIATAGAVRIGDIYMMFGTDAKIQLDYWWEEAPPAAPPPAAAVSAATPSTSAAAPSTTDRPPSLRPSPSALATTLQKLLTIAKLEMLKPKGSAANCVGADSKAHSSKSRLTKLKVSQENVQKTDNQLKFEVCPLPLDEVFRRPIIAPLNAQSKSSEIPNLNLDKMRPRYCNRPGRPRRPTSSVTTRHLTLLPKVTLLPKSSAVSLFNAVTKPQGFKPIAPAPTPSVSTSTCAADTRLAPITIDVKVAPVTAKMMVPAKPELKVEVRVEPSVEAGGGEEAQPPSPPSLSNLLDDLSLPSLASSRLSTPVPSFEGLLSNNGDINISSSCSKDQWISSEVPDLSLSGFSFLNNMDTDIKNISDDTRLSDVDSQLRNLMNTDPTTDLNEIIADLTATIKTNTQPE